MNKDKLLGIIKSQGRTVSSIINMVNNDGVPMSYSTFYKGLRDERPFKTNEIVSLSHAINLSRSEVFDIFFADCVS